MILLDPGQLSSLGGIEPATLIAIRNELLNDGLIYVKHVQPVLKETLADAISFVDAWNNHWSSLDGFAQNLLLV